MAGPPAAPGRTLRVVSLLPSATETLLAAKDAEHGSDEAREALIAETADLWFHSLVMLSHLDLDHQRVLDELARRFGVSGHDEKASRSQR